MNIQNVVSDLRLILYYLERHGADNSQETRNSDARKCTWKNWKIKGSVYEKGRYCHLEPIDSENSTIRVSFFEGCGQLRVDTIHIIQKDGEIPLELNLTFRDGVFYEYYLAKVERMKLDGGLGFKSTPVRDGRVIDSQIEQLIMKNVPKFS